MLVSLLLKSRPISTLRFGASWLLFLLIIITAGVPVIVPFFRALSSYMTPSSAHVTPQTLLWTMSPGSFLIRLPINLHMDFNLTNDIVPA